MSDLIPLFIAIFMAGVFVTMTFMGISMGLLDYSHHSQYKKCRYFDQSIERCVTELGWEKK
jgi:hypothetical protein